MDDLLRLTEAERSKIAKAREPIIEIARIKGFSSIENTIAFVAGEYAAACLEALKKEGDPHKQTYSKRID